MKPQTHTHTHTDDQSARGGGLEIFNLSSFKKLANRRCLMALMKGVAQFLIM